MKDVDAFLKSAFSEICDIRIEDILLDKPLDVLAKWDSLSLVLLLAEIDDEFDIVLPPEKIPNFRTLGDYSDYIKSCL